MERTNNQPQWNAKRLVQEYVKKADYLGMQFENITWSNQIRIKRIASALRAFLGMKGVEEKPLDLIKSVFEGWNFECICENSRLQEEDREHLHALLKDAIADDQCYESIMRMAKKRSEKEHSHMFVEKRNDRDRSFMLHVLLEYRIASEKLISHFDGVGEGIIGAYLGIMAVKGTCLTPLKSNNDKIDDIIVVLLGEKFKQSFTEEDLKANYGYPKETDDELDEWDCDNY